MKEKKNCSYGRKKNFLMEKNCFYEKKKIILLGKKNCNF